MNTEVKVPIRKCPSCNEIMYVHPIKDTNNRWVFYCYYCERSVDEEELKQILEGER